MATALCAWLRRRGVRAAPFKAQNMSNNSYPCPGGGEIGRAQVAQAEACGLEPSVDMNPILLKPSGETESQVVLQGKVWKTLSGREYYEHHEFLASKVQESFDRLASQYEFIVIEGAGSLAELNLRRTDLVNLGLARKLQAPVLLVADIDRGGVFAAVYGTIALLEPAEAALLKAFAVNRFRGDPALFASGARLLEAKTGKPCLGVFPYAGDICLDEEDSVALSVVLDSPAFDAPARGSSKQVPSDAPSVAIAILRLPRVSNLTDFRLLRWAEWIERPCNRQYGVVILPGTKNTVSDLAWMRRQGLDGWVREQHAGGALVIGVCGGYQILGERIEDPLGVESEQRSVPGLGLLPVVTTLRETKTTEAVEAVTANGTRFRAYEIHMGETEKLSQADSFATVGGRPEGVRRNRCVGTYLHGALEDEAVVEELTGFRPPPAPPKSQTYERLADWFEAAADVQFFEETYL